ncbi:long-chain-fatty-acid--CoA ligase-like [Dermacentor variabilis]|uniref:long-chain-fatty-acid--CoA ligase-like n=1 Tax=Dermacentor variabilis TaxID=34621 RepID=UPI003F5B44FE
MQRYAIGFRQNGMRPGDHVSIRVNNSVESLIAMYGCILAGATVFLPHASLTERELRYEVEDGDCTHILTDEPNAEKFNRAVAGLKLKSIMCCTQQLQQAISKKWMKKRTVHFLLCTKIQQ